MRLRDSGGRPRPPSFSPRRRLGGGSALARLRPSCQSGAWVAVGVCCLALAAWLCVRRMASASTLAGSSALGLGAVGGAWPWGISAGGPSRYVAGMQELFRSHSKTREFPAHSAKVHSVAWSCDGRRLASGSFDKTASVFLLEKDRLVRSAPGGGVGEAAVQELGVLRGSWPWKAKVGCLIFPLHGDISISHHRAFAQAVSPPSFCSI